MSVRPALLWALALAAGPALFARPALAADPTKDQCIDANEAAQSLRKSEKLREAEQKLRICVSTTCPGPVRDDCATRLTEVRAITPTIVFSVKDDADQDLSDVRVTMDDQPLTDKLDGTAIPINPGPHHFVFEAPDHVKEERALVVREGEKDRHERIVLVSPVASTVPTEPAPEVHQAVPVEPHPAGGSDGSTQRTAGLVVGGIGVAGIVVGSVFGIVAKSTYNDAVTNYCQAGTNACQPDGVTGGSTAHAQAAVSTVAFIAGGVLAAAGVVLYFTAPRAKVAVTPTVGTNTAGLGLSGSW